MNVVQQLHATFNNLIFINVLNNAVSIETQQKQKDFSCRFSVQTGSEAHPASCTIVPGVLSPGLKRGQGVTLTTHPI
jgi:hypothetical protein